MAQSAEGKGLYETIVLARRDRVDVLAGDDRIAFQANKRRRLLSNLIELGELLKNVRDFNTSHFLYLDKNSVMGPETVCAVLDISDADGVPAFAESHDLSYAMEIASVRDIVANAKAQIPSATVDQLLQAFQFYCKRDAFIAFAS